MWQYRIGAPEQAIRVVVFVNPCGGQASHWQLSVYLTRGRIYLDTVIRDTRDYCPTGDLYENAFSAEQNVQRFDNYE